MPLVSVKLAESTKAQVAELAERRGVTAHAVMVQAIESALAQAQAYDQFVDDALVASQRLASSGQVVDGAPFAAYLRAKAAGNLQAIRPISKSLSSL